MIVDRAFFDCQTLFIITHEKKTLLKNGAWCIMYSAKNIYFI